MTMTSNAAAAYGGSGWSPRERSLRQEIGDIWSACGINSEWSPLKRVLLHRPGSELSASVDPDTVQMLAPVDPDRARSQHDVLAAAYRNAGVAVDYVDPVKTPPPNQLFVADLLFMTPEGVVVARPASTVRAGEERHVAARLAQLGIPVCRTISGQGTFEGADAMWLDTHTVLIGTGFRTNAYAARQLADVLGDMGIATVTTRLTKGAMHLMGALRFCDRDLAVVWHGRLQSDALEALEQRGIAVKMLPNETELINGMALNFVTLGPRRILMPAGNPVTEAFYKSLGIDVLTVAVDEIVKAEGAIGCMTGVLERELTMAS